MADDSFAFRYFVGSSRVEHPQASPNMVSKSQPYPSVSIPPGASVVLWFMPKTD